MTEEEVKAFEKLRRDGYTSSGVDIFTIGESIWIALEKLNKKDES
jgi:hypothetical protein